LPPTPLASIDGFEEASADASGVADALADLDAFGRVCVGFGVGDADAVRKGRGATTWTLPLQPWMEQW